jgi:hypothetical protein
MPDWDRFQFNPIRRNELEEPVTIFAEVSPIHSGQNGRIEVKHQLQTKPRTATTVRSEEAEKITALISSLRTSALDLEKEHAQARSTSDIALRIALETRRNNLTVTIAALEDRLSALRGLIKLDRRYVAHRIH